MRILLIGGGGREHALAWRLSQSRSTSALFATPGNPGIAQHATCLPQPAELVQYADLAIQYGIDLTVVGPEALLVAGIVDEFRGRGLKIVGPTQAAARLEGSKIFAKAFFERAGIPTARSSTNMNDFSFPLVVKADGLAAGKGVVIARNDSEAVAATNQLGPQLVIEEYLEGEEVSFIALSNGQDIVPFQPSQDHKRLRDGDDGPNTGGMGAYADRRILSPSLSDEIMAKIMLPALVQMNKEGTPFTGFLYAGLMMTATGPKLLEFNVRLGDPETQALLYDYRGDLTALLASSTAGGTITRAATTDTCSVCVVLCSEGYPSQPRMGDVISGIPEAESTGAKVFHAGTRQIGDRLVTNAGRVLGVTAGGATLQQAIDSAYAATAKISFAGMHYRRDIGQKGLRRW